MLADLTLPSHSIAASQFFCRHRLDVPFEDVDVPAMLDLKQDSALRVLMAPLRYLDSDQQSCEMLMDQNADIAFNAYRYAKIEFYRQRFGRGKTPISFEPIMIDPVDEKREESRSLEAIAARETLNLLVTIGYGGILPELGQRVVKAMRAAQRSRMRGEKSLPVALRKRISRLRTETGLPLDTSLL